jgi:hypothetical protein
MSSSVSALFRPLPVGAINVNHRVVMAPLTRFRANKDHVHGELAKTYYTQRASVPGTLLVTEATIIAPRAGGYTNAPGIWSDAQIAGWKPVRTSSHLAIFMVVSDSLSNTGHRRRPRKGVFHFPPAMGFGARREPRDPQGRRRLRCRRS